MPRSTSRGGTPFAAAAVAVLRTDGSRLSSTAPRIGITSMTTVHPGGTHNSWPPIMMKTLITASLPGSIVGLAQIELRAAQD